MEILASHEHEYDSFLLITPFFGKDACLIGIDISAEGAAPEDLNIPSGL